MQFLLVAALIFASVVAVFALQNAQAVPIRFFAWERETSVAVISLGAAVVGALAAVLAGLVRQVALGLRHRQLKAELGRVQKELEEERMTKEALLAELARLKDGQEGGASSATNPALEGQAPSRAEPPVPGERLPFETAPAPEGGPAGVPVAPEPEDEVEWLAGDDERPESDEAEAAASSDTPGERPLQNGDEDRR